MKETLGNTGDRLNIIFLGTGSEESVERSEVKRGVDQIIASSVGGIRQLLGKPSVSPEVHLMECWVCQKEPLRRFLFEEFRTMHFGFIKG